MEDFSLSPYNCAFQEDVCRPGQEGAGSKETALVVLLIHRALKGQNKNLILHRQARIYQQNLRIQEVTDRDDFQGNGSGSVSADSREQVGQTVQDDSGHSAGYSY